MKVVIPSFRIRVQYATFLFKWTLSALSIVWNIEPRKIYVYIVSTIVVESRCCNKCLFLVRVLNTSFCHIRLKYRCPIKGSDHVHTLSVLNCFPECSDRNLTASLVVCSWAECNTVIIFISCGGYFELAKVIISQLNAVIHILWDMTLS